LATYISCLISYAVILNILRRLRCPGGGGGGGGEGIVNRFAFITHVFIGV